MPTIPKIKTLTNSSVDILNVIRNNASQSYKDYVPFAQPNAESIREIGTIIMDYPELQNEFLSALVNRIGRVIVASKTYDNPWSIFKRGLMEFGETIEEIFVNIADPNQFDPEVAETEVYKRVMPDVRSAFHVMNYQKFYKVTIQNDQLRQAFLSWEGITDLIAKITETLYTGANYDEFLTMQYMLAKQILNNKMHYISIAGVDTDADAKSTVTTIKRISNDLTFMSDEYNVAHVKTHTAKEEQYIIMTTDFDASIDVNVLASAFNLDKVTFMGRRIITPSFGNLDIERLKLLFEGDSTFEPFTSEEMALLNDVGCVIVDKNYFIILDNLMQFTEKYNGQGLYWNYFYHAWKTFSVSPFANAICATTGTINTAYPDASDLMAIVSNTGVELGTLNDTALPQGGEYLITNINDGTGLPTVNSVILQSTDNLVKIVNGNKIIVTGQPTGGKVTLNVLDIKGNIKNTFDVTISA